MSATAQVENYQFQAETRHLLDLMIHSLYTNKEIFLRELISNASDAIDRLRFEALVRPELIDTDHNPQIILETDRQNRVLTISDNGIGMSRDEVINNIGTIAESGTRALRAKMSEGVGDARLSELIGQFGVGFYSAFMVADKVTMITRRAGEETATLWESTGDGQYSLAPASKDQPGTTITLHLKPQDPEQGIEDYTDKWIISRIVKRYSDFVSYPIVYKGQQESSEGTIDVEEKTLNSMKPIWARPSSEVSEAQYDEFYQQLFHNWDKPLLTIIAKAEGRVDYQAVVFVPAKAPDDLYYHAAEVGLRLYAKGVLVMEQCADLLPRYLRFVKGIVDSSELPLNISRQMLQQERQVGQIRKWLTKKILNSLENTFANEPDKYLSFWKQFGRALKEGMTSDFDNKDKITGLLLFQSSRNAEKLITLKEYVEAMKPEQREIFYVTGASRSVVDNSPHLEAFRKKDYEVLYLVDPVDELLVQYLTEFDGKKLKSISKGSVKLGSEEESEQADKELQQKGEEATELLQFLQQSLDPFIKEVRLTNRLTTSPVCLVGSELDYSPQMERLLQMGQEGGRPRQRRIMELNPQHEIFTRLQERFRQQPDDSSLKDYGELLLGYALLAEGSELPDPVRFNQLVANLITQTLERLLPHVKIYSNADSLPQIKIYSKQICSY
jgi:molecular chaperone HtpG